MGKVTQPTAQSWQVPVVGTASASLDTTRGSERRWFDADIWAETSQIQPGQNVHSGQEATSICSGVMHLEPHVQAMMKITETSQHDFISPEKVKKFLAEINKEYAKTLKKLAE